LGDTLPEIPEKMVFWDTTPPLAGSGRTPGTTPAARSGIHVRNLYERIYQLSSCCCATTIKRYGMKKNRPYRCEACGYIYDPARGEPNRASLLAPPLKTSRKHIPVRSVEKPRSERLRSLPWKHQRADTAALPADTYTILREGNQNRI